MHIVIQMINDPDREENNDDDYGNSRNKNTYIPKSVFFMPNIDEKNELDKGLKKSKTKNSNNCNFIGKIKKLRLDNNKVG